MVVLTPLKDSLSLSDTLSPCGIVFEIKKGTREYSLTLRTLDTNAANIVAISRYQYVRLLPARIVSTYAAPTMFAIFSASCVVVYHFHWDALSLGGHPVS